MQQISIKAPAKLNLRLKVVGRKPDGYHELSMLNATINLFDEIVLFKEGKDLKFESTLGHSQLEGLGPDSANLSFKAAKLFMEYFNLKEVGLLIKLKKCISIGAGLGGGSSDAAATLRAMAQIFESELKRKIEDTELIDLASKLGSDVPYFLKGGLCVVKGKGEQVTQLKHNPLSGKPFLLICPSEHSSTSEVYKQFTQEFPTQNLKADSKLQIAETYYSQIIELISNDLSSVVLKRSKLCKALLEKMQTFDEVVAGVTGSGSALFCLPKAESDILALNRVQNALGAEAPSQILTFC